MTELEFNVLAAFIARCMDPLGTARSYERLTAEGFTVEPDVWQTVGEPRLMFTCPAGHVTHGYLFLTEQTRCGPCHPPVAPEYMPAPPKRHWWNR